MYEDLEMNDTVNDKNFNYGFEYQSPKYADTCTSSNIPSKQ